MSALRVVLALFGIGVVTASFAFTSLVHGAEPLGPAAEPGVARFIVLGDTGTGESGQYDVKEAFMDVCATRGCDFAMINGDLIYETGATSVDDPQFNTKFEQPYADVPFTFYLTLGNHDNSDALDEGTGTDAGKGDVQVAYHYKQGTSGKWHLPARYYNVRVGDVELFSLDTNTMMSYGIVRSGTDPLATAESVDATMIEQTNWIEDAMAASDAPWKIAFGHHPLFANGEHGNAGAYEGQGQTLAGSPFPTTLGLGVKQFVESHVCGKADVYFAGHDHDLEWIQERPSCPGTELIVSGAGAKSRELQDPTRNPAHFQQGGTLGFWWIELRGDSFTAAAYDADARLLFERTTARPMP